MSYTLDGVYLKAISDRPRPSPVIKEAITVGRVAAKALGYTKNKREQMNGIEAFMMSTGVFQVLLSAIETIPANPTCHWFL